MLSLALIALGTLLVPAAIVSSWTHMHLTDTDAFVRTVGPLIDEPAVQELITVEVVAAIDAAIDIDGLTNEVFEGIGSLDIPPRSAAALDLLRGPASAGFEALITGAVERVIASDAFSGVWATAVRVSHEQFIAAMRGDEGALVAIGGGGEVGIRLGPIVERVRTELLAGGISLAARIPTIDRAIVLAQLDGIQAAPPAYALAVGAGVWLPWVALVLLAGGVLAARPRARSLAGAALAVAVVTVLLGAALAVARILLIGQMAPALMSNAAATLIFDQIVAELVRIITIAAVVALVVAVVAWLSGTARVPVAARSAATAVTASLRGVLRGHGFDSGRAGALLHRRRTVLRGAVALGAAVAIVVVRPLSSSVLIATALLAALALLLLELLSNPHEDTPRDAVEELASVPEAEPEPERTERLGPAGSGIRARASRSTGGAGASVAETEGAS